MHRTQPLYLADILALPQQTDVVGDVELFLRYIDSGQATADYDRMLAEQQRRFAHFQQTGECPCDASEE